MMFHANVAIPLQYLGLQEKYGLQIPMGGGGGGGKPYQASDLKDWIQWISQKHIEPRNFLSDLVIA